MIEHAPMGLGILFARLALAAILAVAAAGKLADRDATRSTVGSVCGVL